MLIGAGFGVGIGTRVLGTRAGPEGLARAGGGLVAVVFRPAPLPLALLLLFRISDALGALSSVTAPELVKEVDVGTGLPPLLLGRVPSRLSFIAMRISCSSISLSSPNDELLGK